MIRTERLVLAFALAGAPVIAAPAPKLPKDAPTCAMPGARQLFLSPMGQPFRSPAGQPYPSATWFAAVDRNHDGAIDRAEFVADAARFFETLDLDRDRRISPEEVIAYERDVAPEIAIYASRPEPDTRGDRSAPRDELAGASSASGGAAYGGPLGAGRFAWLNIPEPVASADADVNRMIDADEFAAAAGRRFDTLDKAGESRLRLSDLPKTPAQMAIEGPCRPRKPPKGRALPPLPDVPPSAR